MSLQRSFTLTVVAAASFAAVLTTAAPSSAAASTDQTAILAVVQNYGQAISHGNSGAASCLPQAQITDDFPPHQWTSCAAWYKAFVASGVTDLKLNLGTPWHNDVSGNVAYVVIPAGFTLKMGGKTQTMQGAVWTFVMRKSNGSWHIAGWTWASH